MPLVSAVPGTKHNNWDYHDLPCPPPSLSAALPAAVRSSQEWDSDTWYTEIWFGIIPPEERTNSAGLSPRMGCGKISERCSGVLAWIWTPAAAPQPRGAVWQRSQSRTPWQKSSSINSYCSAGPGLSNQKWDRKGSISISISQSAYQMQMPHKVWLLGSRASFTHNHGRSCNYLCVDTGLGVLIWAPNVQVRPTYWLEVWARILTLKCHMIFLYKKKFYRCPPFFPLTPSTLSPSPSSHYCLCAWAMPICI